MQKTWFIIFLSAVLLNTASYAEVIKLEAPKKASIQLNKTQTEDDRSLLLQNRDAVQDLIKIQKEDEVKDIETLWNAAVNNNTLIKYTLNKLNTPESQKRLHSSLLAKGLSSLIYGASFIPMFTGSNSIIQSASFSAGRLANNYLNRNARDDDPKNTPVSDTELIQLAGTIEELQEKIISSYYEYKGALNKLKDTRAKIILYNKNYSNALKNNSMTELIVSSALYEDMQMQEYFQEQEAKKHYLSLERLSGRQAVDSLILSQYALKNQLVNTEKINRQ